MLTAAVLVQPDDDLARSLGILPPDQQDDVLVAVFADRRAPQRPSTTSPEDRRVPPADSALCVFPMEEVRRRFTGTIQQCFRGNGTTGPDHYVQPRPCYRTVSTQCLQASIFFAFQQIGLTVAVA